jgi:hypothetical protein
MNDTDRQLQSIAAVTKETSISTLQPTTSPPQNVGNSKPMYSSNLLKLVLYLWMGSKLPGPSSGVEDSKLSTVPRWRALVVTPYSQQVPGWTLEIHPRLERYCSHWVGLGLFLVDVPLLEQFELANDVVVGGLSKLYTSASGHIINTNLSEIDGIVGGAPYDIWISDNPRLQTVNLPTSQIRLQYNTSYTGNLLIANNHLNITVNLPNLTSAAGSISVGNVSSLSIPSLAIINGSMSVTNASFPSLSAPQLQTVLGDMNISGTFSGYSLRVWNIEMS